MILAAVQLAQLGTTLAIEVPIAALAAPRDRRRAAALTSLFANLASHSLASAAMWWIGADGRTAPWIAIEALVVVLEALAFRFVGRLSWARASAISAVSNVITASLASFLS